MRFENCRNENEIRFCSAIIILAYNPIHSIVLFVALCDSNFSIKEWFGCCGGERDAVVACYTCGCCLVVEAIFSANLRLCDRKNDVVVV